MPMSRLLFSFLCLLSNNLLARASGSTVAKTTYVVVGGTAGLAVATRLSEDSANNVIVLEAGSDGFNNPNIGNLSGPSIEALPETIAMTRGKVLGQFYRTSLSGSEIDPFCLSGSSAVNGMLLTRPNKMDLDLWESVFGATGWNWDTISASIKMAEHFSATEGLTSTLSFHGTSGPICDSQRTLVGDVWGQGVIPAVLACNGRESVDQNGGDPSGIWYTPKAMFPNSTRSSSANSYYQPCARRTNLHVKLNVTVSRILWGQSQNGKAFATGVEYINTAGKKHTASVSGARVILSAGAFGTPQVLELSDHQPPWNSTVVNLPAVGEVKISVNVRLDSSTPSFGSTPLSEPTTKYLAPLASCITNSGLQLTLNCRRVPPQTPQLLRMAHRAPASQDQPTRFSHAAHKALKAMFMNDSTVVEFMGFPMPTTLLFLPILLHPMSRGSSHIVSGDAMAAPAFDLARLVQRNNNKPLALVSNRRSNFNLYILTKATQRVRRFATQPSLTPFLAGTKTAPGAGVTTDTQFEKFVKDSIGVAYHPAIGSVVDENLAVKGSTNVFVVDGSIIPFQPGSHPSSIIYGIGEKAAAMLKASSLTYDV
ncbi:hypothetical protein B0H13DRAFT_2372569 [Mycena leptocephala]|nr:hypothetical protein B0H13DRAFT_2372569 [Mycena leptocephala]